MDLKNLDMDTKKDMADHIASLSSLEDVRAEAARLGISFAPAAKIASLKGKLIDALLSEPGETEEVDPLDSALDGGSTDDDDEPIMISKPKKLVRLSDHDLIMMDPNKTEDPVLRRRIVRAKALRMMRVRIQSLDPSDSQLNGVIVTALNKYTGKISKYVPFSTEVSGGYYVPQMLLDVMSETKFPRRIEKKNTRFGIKQYQTIMSPKYNIEILPHLTAHEIDKLADIQRASGAIDQTELTS